MPRFDSLLHRAFGEAEAIVDWMKYQMGHRRAPGDYHIQPYRGHGTAETLYISGRVFQGLPVPPARENDAVIRNLWHSVRRLGADEVPAARVRASVAGATETVLADDEGLFHVTLPAHTTATGGESWRQIELELVDPAPESGVVKATGFSIVPPPEARFGIVSDIDDTVVRTEVANVLRMLRLVLLTNAHTRLPFEGVAGFYRALHAGAAGPSTNPIFYVSSSPWNFYDLLMEVFHVHDIPAGPLFLKDYGLARDLLLSLGHVEHKVEAIGRIFETHPDLPFVLIGDSGQKDPEVYREIVRRFSGRVLAVYIRDVSPEQRDDEVRAIAAEIASAGIDTLLVADIVAAAEHAASVGLIDPASLADVRGERAQDRRAAGPFAAAVKKE
ncbi:MAG TPA: phosphatase domain-containing protein [Longimicrobiaceae bacterium]|nr:phosphatase domain-containing protein [Longimicrobiaceae bacterium]